MFQSSPDLVTGRYNIGNVRMLKSDWFQSSPDLVTGRYCSW